MKKLPFLLLFVLMASTLQAQKDTVQVHTDADEYNYKWKIVSQNKSNPNKGCYGCASFYYKVMRTNTPDKEGSYHFFLYLSSNSFYKSGGHTSTYVRDLTVSLISKDEKIMAVEIPYVLVPPRSETFSGVHLAAKFVAENPQQKLNVSWGEYTVY